MAELSYVVGLDLGTTACKVMLFDMAGKAKAFARREYPLYAPSSEISEQDAQDWWNCICSGMREVLKKSGVGSGKVAGVSISGQFPSFVYVDKSGRPAGRVMTYQDARANEQANFIVREVGAERLVELIGLPPSFFPTLPVAKILWLRDHHPSVYKLVSKFMGAKDFINYRLTGSFKTDFIEAWWTGLARVRDYSWSDELLEILGIQPDRLCEIVKPQDVVGCLTKEAAKATGLKEDTPVICGTADGMCNALGSGTIREGVVADSAGGTEIIATAMSRKMPSSMGESTFCWPHLIPDLWIVYTSTATSGSSLRWFKDQLAFEEREAAERKGISPYELLDAKAEQIEAGAGKLIFLPYMAGEYTPFFDLKARGVFFGLSLDKRGEHLARSILEGVAFSLRHTLEALEDLGVRIDEVRTSGGGSRSRLWNRIKADVTGKPVSVLDVSETGCLGAALLAAIGVGLFHDVESASKAMVRVRETLEPDESKFEFYSKLFKIYTELYERLRAPFSELASI